jgi:hypothetical protein
MTLHSLVSLTVYPETKGVPLEEMDAVFGEGNVSHMQLPYFFPLIKRIRPDAREERLDNESEAASLVSNSLPSSHRDTGTAWSGRSGDGFWGLLSRLFGNEPRRSRYQPVSSEE